MCWVWGGDQREKGGLRTSAGQIEDSRFGVGAGGEMFLSKEKCGKNVADKGYGGEDCETNHFTPTG